MTRWTVSLIAHSIGKRNRSVPRIQNAQRPLPAVLHYRPSDYCRIHRWKDVLVDLALKAFRQLREVDLSNMPNDNLAQVNLQHGVVR